MAWAETVTKLPLDTWANFYGINPLHFNGIYIPDASDLCSGVWNQYEWQDSDRVGREAIARAIQMAEDGIEQALGFRLLPAWEVEEWHQFPHSLRPEHSFYPQYGSVNGGPVVATTNWGHLIAGGIKKSTLIRDDASVVYYDKDLDEYEETAIVKVTNALVSESTKCEFHLFYPDEPTKEIRPVQRSVSGTTITFTFRREQCVKTEKLVGLNVLSLLADDDDHFLQTVDVYRITNDPLTQVTFFDETSSTLAGFLTVQGEPRVGEARIYSGTYDSDTAVWLRSPLFVDCNIYDRFQLHYYAGYRDRRKSCPFDEMAEEWRHAVAIFSATFLDRPPCTCGGVSETWEYWSRDMAFSGGADELARYNIQRQDLNNPFGTKLGAITVWKQVKNWIRYRR